MLKKRTSFLALFLAFAMAITGMPANYAYAVETEPETEKQSEEVLEETIEETLEDVEDILDDDAETLIDDEEMTDDSEELGDEIDESLLDEDISNEVPEETEVAVATTSSSWDDKADLCGGYLTFEPDEDAFTREVTWIVNNRENDEDFDNDASDIIWSYVDSRLKKLIESKNEKVEMDRVTWWDAEFFDLDYYQDGTPIELANDTKVRVTYNFDADSNMKETIHGIGGPDDSPTLKIECTNFFYQVYYLDKNGAPTLISENFSKDSEKVTFDSKAAGAYMILRLPAADDEITYHFNNYQESVDPLKDPEACRYMALSSQSGGTGNVTFDIKGTNTWNSRDKDTAFTYSYGDIKFIGDGSITINTDLNSFEWGDNIIFDGPNVTVNGDIYPGVEWYKEGGAPGAPQTEEDKKKYNRCRWYKKDGIWYDCWYADKDLVLNDGVLNFNPVNMCNQVIVKGGTLNAKGSVYRTEPIILDLHALGGTINVTGDSKQLGIPLISELGMGNSDVTITGKNCLEQVYVADRELSNDEANLKVVASGTGVSNILIWKGGTCEINANVGVGVPNPKDKSWDGLVVAEGGNINITAKTVGVYGCVSLDSYLSDDTLDPQVNISAGTIGIQQTNKWVEDDCLIETLGKKGKATIYGKTQAVKPATQGNIIVDEKGKHAFISAGNTLDSLKYMEDDEITNQKYLIVQLGKKVQVTLDTGFDEGAIVSTNRAYGKSVEITVPCGALLNLNPKDTELYETVGREGYVLTGWKKEGASDDTASMTYQMPNDEEDPVTLVAVWEKEVTLNAPVLKDIKGDAITEDKTLPKNSKLYLSTTVTINGKETPADSNVVEIWYRTKDGDYTLYEDAIVVDDDLEIGAFAVEKGVVKDTDIVVDDKNKKKLSASWVSSHDSDVKKLNGGSSICVYRMSADTSVIEDETDRTFYEGDADFEDSFWAAYVQEYDYTGKPVKPSDVHVYFDTRRLVEKTDYTLSYKNNTNAGEATMIATFKGNYKGKYEMPFKIKQLDIGDADITLAPVTFTGKPIKPSPKLTYELGGKVVTLGAKDYELVMPETDVNGVIEVVDGKLVEPGKYEIEVKGKGNYANADGEKTCFIFEIVPKTTALMSKTKVSLDKNKFEYIDYKGEAIEPTVTVKDGKVALAQGLLVSNEEFADPGDNTYDGYSYVYTYLDNTDVGTAKVFVRATGNEDSLTGKIYAGEAFATFTINGLKMSAALVKPEITRAYIPEGPGFADYKPLDAMACPETDNLADYGVTYKLKVDGVMGEYGLCGISKVDYAALEDEDKRYYDFIYEYVGDTASAGKIKINIIGVNAFTGTKTVQYEIKGVALSTTDIKLDEEYDYTYSGSQMKPGVTVTPKLEEAPSLVEHRDYEVSYGENIKAGKNKGTVTITGKGLYNGNVKKTFTIAPMSLEAGGFGVVGFGGADEEGRYIHLEDVPYEKGGVKLDGFLRFDGRALVSGTDYTATYKNNTKPGKAVVTLKGKGNFAGEWVGTYNIVQQDLSNVVIFATDIVYQDKAGICKPKVTLTDINGKALGAKTDYDANLVYTYNKSTTVTQKVNVGRTTNIKTLVRSAGDCVDLKKDIIPKGAEIRVTVTADENDKYAGSMFYKGTTSTVFKYVGADISKAAVKVSDQVMTGEPIYITKDDITEITVNKVRLNPSDYEIMNSTYTKNVGKGRASVTIRGVGNYGGTKVINFNIVVPTALP